MHPEQKSLGNVFGILFGSLAVERRREGRKDAWYDRRTSQYCSNGGVPQLKEALPDMNHCIAGVSLVFLHCFWMYTYGTSPWHCSSWCTFIFIMVRFCVLYYYT